MVYLSECSSNNGSDSFCCNREVPTKLLNNECSVVSISYCRDHALEQILSHGRPSCRFIWV